MSQTNNTRKNKRKKGDERQIGTTMLAERLSNCLERTVDKLPTFSNTELKKLSRHFQAIDRLAQKTFPIQKPATSAKVLGKLLLMQWVVFRDETWQAFLNNHSFAKTISAFTLDLATNTGAAMPTELAQDLATCDTEKKLEALAQCFQESPLPLGCLYGLQKLAFDQTERCCNFKPRKLFLFRTPSHLLSKKFDAKKHKTDTQALFLYDTDLPASLLYTYLSVYEGTLPTKHPDWLWTDLRQYPTKKTEGVQQQLFGQAETGMGSCINRLRSTDLHMSFLVCLGNYLPTEKDLRTSSNWRYESDYDETGTFHKHELGHAQWAAQKTRSGSIALLVKRSIIADPVFRELRAVWETCFDEIFMLDFNHEGYSLVLLVRQ